MILYFFPIKSVSFFSLGETFSVQTPKIHCLAMSINSVIDYFLAETGGRVLRGVQGAGAAAGRERMHRGRRWAAGVVGVEGGWVGARRGGGGGTWRPAGPLCGPLVLGGGAGGGAGSGEGEC